MFRKAFTATLMFTFLFTIAALAPQVTLAEAQTTMVVDINTAPLQVLEGVVGDEDLARQIIDNRPYANKRQLISRGLMSAEQYDEIKDRIVARRVQDPENSR